MSAVAMDAKYSDTSFVFKGGSVSTCVMKWQLDTNGRLQLTMADKSSHSVKVLHVARIPNGFRVCLENKARVFDMFVSADAKNKEYTVMENGNCWEVTSVRLKGGPARMPAPEPDNDAQRVKSPSMGVICEVLVNAGDRVSTGAPLIRIEAMKVITTVSAKQDAMVKRVCVSVGQSVGRGDVLIECE